MFSNTFNSIINLSLPSLAMIALLVETCTLSINVELATNVYVQFKKQLLLLFFTKIDTLFHAVIALHQSLKIYTSQRVLINI